MDVRFYPAAAGDPAGLDFAQCLGYYGYSKVTGPGRGRRAAGPSVSGGQRWISEGQRAAARSGESVREPRPLGQRSVDSRSLSFPEAPKAKL
ncbi:hypothetical protein J1605_000572 [Eschrichtius robustus]|uniref:Uncharacterized protein n=1 Tax=Eschrichtius robustus TaxID=9764 RepID=A0AB34GTG4_ESCRO|nr:hypothetical protein J1605_000572 [Eschrichtius robustus]